MNYELRMRPPQNQYKLFKVPCCYFSWLSPHFSPFLMFPWKCAERFFKSETLLIIWSSTTVTAQQLAVGECWAGLGLGCWVELETKVREGFIVTLKDPTRAFTFRSASKICLDAMFRWPFSLLPCEECSTRASSGHCENFVCSSTAESRRAEESRVRAAV